MAHRRTPRFILTGFFGTFAWMVQAPLLTHARENTGLGADEHTVRRIHVRGETMSKRLKHRVDPIYPQLARQQAVEGTVKLQIIVSTDGAVTQAKLLSGPGLLTKAAVDAVLQWTYEPTSISNQVVEVETNVDIVFKLASKITDSTPDR